MNTDMPLAMMTRRLRYLSLGAGVQSTTLALLATHGAIEAPDCAIFADTQWESAATYAQLAWLEARLPFPVYRVTAGSLRQHVLDGAKTSDASSRGVYRGIPAYVRPGDNGAPIGMLGRQCTREYKIAPINAKVRELLGLSPRQRVPKGHFVECLTGISRDEAHRMKPAQEAWIHRVYPLIDLDMTRSSCIAWLREHGYPDPPRSACIGCPLHTVGEWERLRTEDPAGWTDAVEVDEAIRHGLSGGIAATEVYLHARGKPLGETVDDRSDQGDLFGGGMGNECEGMCGT